MYDLTSKKVIILLIFGKVIHSIAFREAKHFFKDSYEVQVTTFCFNLEFKSRTLKMDQFTPSSGYLGH